LPGYGRRSCQQADQEVFFGPGTEDGQEGQIARLAREAAAKALCARCPIVAGCAAWALGDATTWEQYGIWGGLTAAERGRRRREEQERAGVAHEWQRSQQRDQLLAVMAGHRDSLGDVVLRRVGKDERVRAAVGLDERTVSWQTSRMCGLLGVERTATVDDLLRAAAAKGVWSGPVPPVREQPAPHHVLAVPAVVAYPVAWWRSVEVLMLPGIEVEHLRRPRVRRRPVLRVVRPATVVVEVLTIPGLDAPHTVRAGRGARRPVLAAAA
jgi:WhiB family redox-sensing transcriptional regulator